MSNPISLIPLTKADHADALQEVYLRVAAYWEMYNLPTAPAGQAARDFDEAAATPGRHMLGIARRVDRLDPQAGGELVGLVDFRLGWPDADIVYLGMIMVAEPYQRQGIGRRAWRMLFQWLRKNTDATTVRLGVEQFNPGALKFFQALGFTLTGKSDRVQTGEKFVRLLYMELELTA